MTNIYVNTFKRPRFQVTIQFKFNQQKVVQSDVNWFVIDSGCFARFVVLILFTTFENAVTKRNSKRARIRTDNTCDIENLKRFNELFLKSRLSCTTLWMGFFSFYVLFYELIEINCGQNINKLFFYQYSILNSFKHQQVVICLETVIYCISAVPLSRTSLWRSHWLDGSLLHSAKSLVGNFQEKLDEGATILQELSRYPYIF